VVRERYYRDPDFVASYQRELSVAGRRVGRSRLLAVFNDLNVTAAAADANRLFVALLRGLRTRVFRTELARQIAVAADIEPRMVTVSPPRTPRIGNGAVSLAIALRAQGVAFQATLTFLRVDRVLSTIALVGSPGRRLFRADVDRLTHVAAQRIGEGLLPGVEVPPVVVGAPVVGTTLTASAGRWSGDSLAFEHQWERCVEPGVGCSPIPGATASNYTVVENDLESSLRVVVTARNRLASATSITASTAFVSGPPGSPTVVFGRRPVVEGVVGPGATLNVTTGEWTGAPTSFGFQWRRCNPLTSACVDVPGATEQTYTLGPADSGTSIRVLVVARNAVGAGGAVTAASAPSP
jgi:hypothetical protein